MTKYECGPCGYVYDPEIGDPENGIEPGTAFADLPEDWTCPICGVGKDMFEEVQCSGRSWFEIGSFLSLQYQLKQTYPWRV